MRTVIEKNVLQYRRSAAGHLLQCQGLR
jgi:hypothetical protein